MYSQSRKYTCRLMELVDEGIVDPKLALQAALCYMSESEVEDMMRVNDLLDEYDEQEEAA